MRDFVIYSPISLVSIILAVHLSACGLSDSRETAPQRNGSLSSESNTDETADGALDGAMDELAPPPTYRENLVFTHKLIRSTSDNPPISSLGYECDRCTFEQWKSIIPGEGWSKGPAQILIADSGMMRTRPTHDDYPSAVNFLDEVPGDEYELIVINIGGEIIEASPARVVVRAEVTRDTVLQFNPGRLLHILTSPEGVEYVLFGIGVDPDNLLIPDADDPALLEDFEAPQGWLYSTEITTDGETLDAPGFASVIAVRNTRELTWERRN